MTAHLKHAFPALESEGCQQTSSGSEKYNCIAWAAGQQTRWWWPYQHPGYYWPEGQPREVTLAGFSHVFVSLGYEQCNDGAPEADFEKVAIYSLNGKPTHAARQLACYLRRAITKNPNKSA